MINQGDVVTLNDDKNYSVAYTAVLNSNNYAFLVDQDDYTNTMFCRFNNDNGLEEIVEPEIIEQLLNSFVNE